MKKGGSSTGAVGQFCEVARRVGAGAQDEHDGPRRCALVKHAVDVDADDRRLHEEVANRLRHVQHHRAVDAVGAEAAQQTQPLEVAHCALVRLRVRARCPYVSTKTFPI